MRDAVDSWTKEDEKQWKQRIRQLFEAKLEQALETYGSPLEVGNRLGEVKVDPLSRPKYCKNK